MWVAVPRHEQEWRPSMVLDAGLRQSREGSPPSSRGAGVMQGLPLRLDASVASFTKTAEQVGGAQQIAAFPEAGHRLQLAAGDSFVAGYLDTLREWVQAHSRPR
jgi:hypothetical protein